MDSGGGSRGASFGGLGIRAMFTCEIRSLSLKSLAGCQAGRRFRSRRARPEKSDRTSPVSSASSSWTDYATRPRKVADGADGLGSLPKSGCCGGLRHRRAVQRGRIDGIRRVRGRAAGAPCQRSRMIAAAGGRAALALRGRRCLANALSLSNASAVSSFDCFTLASSDRSASRLSSLARTL